MTDERIAGLKPCPFCGEPPSIGTHGLKYSVICSNERCPVMPTTYADAYEQVKAVWNTRATDDEVERHRWIPVKERLPEPLEDVLCSNYIEKEVSICFMRKDGSWVDLTEKDPEHPYPVNPTHWSPLPEAPEGK